MKAITTTLQLKKLNPELFKNNNLGDIKRFSKLPNVFFSPNYFKGQRTDNYHTLPEEITQLDGFYNIVDIAYNSLTEKLSVLFFDSGNKIFTHNIIPLSQLEIDENLANKEEAEDEAEEQRNEDEGIRLVRRFRKRLRRRKKRGALNSNQYDRLRRDLKDVYALLKNGDWDLAIVDVALVSYTNTTLQDEVNWITVKINEYLIEQFSK